MKLYHIITIVVGGLLLTTLVSAAYNTQTDKQSATNKSATVPVSSATSPPTTIPPEPIYVNHVIAVDADKNGTLDEKSIRLSKDALLTEKGPTKLIGDSRATFKDQEGQPQVLLRDKADLTRLDSNKDKKIDKNDRSFGTLSISYQLLNGRMQTVTLPDAGIKAIHFEQSNKFTLEKDDGSQEDVQFIEVKNLGGKP